MRTTRRMTTLMVTGLAATALLNVDLAGQAGGGGQAAAPTTETLSQTFRGSRGRDVEYQKIAPIKVFDNLYHVGPGTVSAWLIPTTDGLILIDTVQEPYVDSVCGSGVVARLDRASQDGRDQIRGRRNGQGVVGIGSVEVKGVWIAALSDAVLRERPC